MAREGTTRELLRTDTSKINFRAPLKAAGKSLKHVRTQAVQRFFEDFVSQLEERIKDGEQSILDKSLKGMDFEENKSCSSQYIVDICDRWVQWFRALHNATANAEPEYRRRAQCLPPVHTSK